MGTLLKRRLALALMAVALPLAPLHAVEADAARPGVEEWLAEPSRIFEAAAVDLEAFRWIARPVVIFADTQADPAFTRQLDLLQSRIDDLVERDVVIVIDTDPAARTPLREKLRPRGFMLALIGKDGGVKLRKPFPWDVRELTRSIDKMPMRKQEIRDRRDRGL
jgi:hypothetical protein